MLTSKTLRVRFGSRRDRARRQVVLIFSDDQKRISVRLSEGGNDLEKGRLSASSPLGKAILGAEEGDEVELPLENGRQRKVLIESVEKGASAASISADAANGLGAVQQLRETKKKAAEAASPQAKVRDGSVLSKKSDFLAAKAAG